MLINGELSIDTGATTTHRKGRTVTATRAAVTPAAAVTLAAAVALAGVVAGMQATTTMPGLRAAVGLMLIVQGPVGAAVAEGDRTVLTSAHPCELATDSPTHDSWATNTSTLDARPSAGLWTGRAWSAGVVSDRH